MRGCGDIRVRWGGQGVGALTSQDAREGDGGRDRKIRLGRIRCRCHAVLATLTRLDHLERLSTPTTLTT